MRPCKYCKQEIRPCECTPSCEYWWVYDEDKNEGYKITECIQAPRGRHEPYDALVQLVMDHEL